MFCSAMGAHASGASVIGVIDDTSKYLISGVSNHHCRYLITLTSSAINYALLSTTDSVRTFLLVRSLMQSVAATCLSHTAAYSYTCVTASLSLLPRARTHIIASVVTAQYYTLVW